MTNSEQFPRLFTVEEANNLLPVLRPLVKQIFDKLDLLKEESQTVILEEGLEPNHPELMERLQGNDGIARLIREVKELVGKINGYGCICKGIEQGLVDFPCQFSGEIVFLCWRYGEESLTHWHLIEDGFAGRKPLLDSSSGGSDISYH
ncbi:MAG TPA: DUF2203 domain-containing protein [Candidatus Binatia bacterium]|jgi:hypothetical protein|nr:DUF2203 domain-containing protein [Candidatus Binatia bacterium]